MPEEKKNSSVIMWSVILLVIAVASYGVVRYMKRDNVAMEVTNGMPILGTNTEEMVVAPYLYKDGVYSVTGEYLSPGGAEEIGLKVTMKDDVVVGAEMEVRATRPISLKMQEAVKSNFKPLVVGKKIDEVVLDKVSGSSLTPKGFNDAIEKIKVQAKA